MKGGHMDFYLIKEQWSVIMEAWLTNNEMEGIRQQIIAMIEGWA